MLGDKTCLVLCYQSILAARVKLLDLEKIVDRVIRFLEAAMAENLRRSVESFHIAVNGVADEPGAYPRVPCGVQRDQHRRDPHRRARDCSTPFAGSARHSCRGACRQADTQVRSKSPGVTPWVNNDCCHQNALENSTTMLGKMSTASKSLHGNVVAQEVSS